jgi:succinate-semialdehyde dehydrogenase/glutarate-semialdehyde dehydrogenase
MLKYTDPVNVAVLKKQVLTPSPDITYEKHVKQTLVSLKAMRRLRLR